MLYLATLIFSPIYPIYLVLQMYPIGENDGWFGEKEWVRERKWTRQINHWFLRSIINPWMVTQLYNIYIYIQYMFPCFVIHQTMFISCTNETITMWCAISIFSYCPTLFLVGCNLLKIALLIAKINRNGILKKRVRKMDTMSAHAII